MTGGRSLLQPDSTVQHIVVVKLDHAGDVLWITPTLTTLRENFPDARISVVCTPYTCPVLVNNPAVDALIPYSGGAFPEVLPRPDLALCLDTRTPAVRLTYSTRARIRTGYYYFPRGLSVLWPLLLLTQPLLHPASRGDFAHEVEVNRRLLERLGCRTDVRTPTRIFLSAAERQTAQHYLAERGYRGGLLLALHLPLKWLDGGWPAEQVALLAQSLSARRPEATLMISCGPGEESLLRSIEAQLPPQSLIITGQSFRSWAALLEQSRLLVCRDCGPVHVAAALGVPVVSVFEESKRKEHTRWEPWAVPHQNLFRPDQHSPAAAEAFLADVMPAVDALLAGPPPNSSADG